MNSKQKINRVFGWILLVVFTVSITPKIYFHNILTHHTDASFANPTGKGTSIGSYEFSCGFVNIESPSPFLEVKDCIFQPIGSFVNAQNEPIVFRPAGALLAHITLRGPPAYN